MSMDLVLPIYDQDQTLAHLMISQYLGQLHHLHVTSKLFQFQFFFCLPPPFFPEVYLTWLLPPLLYRFLNYKQLLPRNSEKICHVWPCWAWQQFLLYFHPECRQQVSSTALRSVEQKQRSFSSNSFLFPDIWGKELFNLWLVCLVDSMALVDEYRSSHWQVRSHKISTHQPRTKNGQKASNELVKLWQLQRWQILAY